MSTVVEVSQSDRALAREVIDEACKRPLVDDALDFEAVILERWPSHKGGVGFSHIRTRAHVWAAIREFYAP